jgi:hypothetical protein
MNSSKRTFIASTLALVLLTSIPAVAVQNFHANGHWVGNFDINGEHGTGTRDPSSGTLHVKCSGNGQCVSISPDHKDLVVWGISTLPNNGYDPNDPIQSSEDFVDAAN